MKNEILKSQILELTQIPPVMTTLEQVTVSGSVYTTSTVTGRTASASVFGGSNWESVQPKEFCRLCGKEVVMYQTKLIHRFCPFCNEKVIDSFFGEYFEKAGLSKDDNFCHSCKSHVNACKCEKSEALKKLKQ